MAQFKTSLVIHRPVEEVFTFVSNYQNSPRWVSGALQHTKVSAGPIGVGTVIRTTGRTMGVHRGRRRAGRPVQSHCAARIGGDPPAVRRGSTLAEDSAGEVS